MLEKIPDTNSIQEPIYSDFYTEKVIILKPEAESLTQNGDAIRQALLFNNAVGCVGGYYDDELSIIFMTKFFMYNLNYDYEEFMKNTGGSFKKLIHHDDLHLFEPETFHSNSGENMFRMIMSDGTPIYVTTFQLESTDRNGIPIWVMAVRIGWDMQNLEFVNGVIQSGIWYIDFNPDSTIQKVNWSHKFRNMLGFSSTEDFPNEIEAWENRLHPEEHDKVISQLFAAAKDKTNKTRYDIEHRLKNNQGIYRWYRTGAEKINRRIDGTPSRMVGIFVDIDDEYRTRQENDKYSAIHKAYSKSNLCEFYIDLHDDTFESLKPDAFFLENQADISSWDELVSSYVENHIEKESRNAIKLLFDRSYIREELQTNNGELSAECRAEYNGNTYWIRNTVIPGDNDQNGIPRHAIIFLRDVTNSRLAEENLHRLAKDNKEMDLLLHGMVRMINRYVVCDFHKNSYMLIDRSKSKTIKKSGTYDEMVAELSRFFKPISDTDTIPKLFSREAMRNNLQNEADVYSFEYCTRDESMYKSLSAIPLEFKNGSLSRVLLMVQDVTNAKKKEHEARNALRDAFLSASRANEAKTVFMSNMSHDIRTPMNAIIGMTAIAGANIDDKNRVLDCLGKITQSSRHLLSLINEVLDMNQIERGSISLAEEEFKLPELIDDLITMVKPGVELHRHKLSVIVSDINHEAVVGDKARIQQIFVNIVGNAIKYTPDGGKINIKISEKPTNTNTACYEFIVEDNGIGMSKEFQKIIFEPFARADNDRTSKIPGTGLGMPITKNIISMMNGDIKVESEPDKGSRFTITMFLRIQESEMTDAMELAHLPVLVADDDRECCEAAVHTLSEIGMDGEYVLSGQEAVERTVERHESNSDFFAVILDWKMPGMDGIETTREIRRRVGSNIPIIVFTAYDCSEIEQAARDAGVDAFITKPLFRSRLLSLFKGIISGVTRNFPSITNDIHYLEKSDHSGKRILLVEDNDLNREIAQELIEMTGAKTECAENGQIAVDMIMEKGSHYYDIVFMDIQMPVMNGYEATKVIRSIPGCDKLPIIAMTANAFAEDVILAKKSGMNEHIAKPLELKRMSEVLDRWL